MEDERLARRVWALFTPYRAALMLIVAAVLVSSGLGIIPPFLTKALFDRALFPVDGGPVDLGLLSWLVAALVAIPILGALVGVYQTYQTTLLGNRVMADLRGRLFEHLQRMDLAFFTQESLSDMTAITEESLSVSGILLAKVFNRQADEVARYRGENARQVELQVRQAMTGQSFFAVVQTFMGVTPALVYLVAGLLIAAGSGVSAGTVVAFTTLQTRLLFPTVNLLRVSLDVQTSLALFRRIFEYLDLRPRIVDAPDARTLDVAAVTGRVELQDVSFAYPTDDENADPTWAVRDVSFVVEPGQLAAIVGPSGAGKTTVSYLIPRLYDVDDGRVLIDGNDVRALTQASVATAVGMVTQDTYLLHTTIEENLRYAKPDATQEELEAAARAANIHDRIVSFPDGYATVVGERGYRLSGGEQQRLAIARVLLKDPPILVLDEATSALDTTSERLVQQALENATRRRTTIAIAHRLSTVLGADLILAVDAGRVVERGTHAELLARGGLYARLYTEQFAGGAVEARCADGVLFRDGTAVVGRPAPGEERVA